MIKIDTGRCTSCGSCVDVCPARIFSLLEKEGNKQQIKIQRQANCIVCGHCVAICPVDAVIHDKLPREQFKDLEPVDISTSSMNNLLLSRRSIRNFKNKPVPRELIENMFNAAVHAGTASNLQNIKFTVIQDQKILDDIEDLVINNIWKRLRLIGNFVIRKLARIIFSKKEIQTYHRYYRSFKEMRETGKLRGMVFRGAPVAMMVDAPGKNSLLVANCALASVNMTLVAQTQGLGTCWIGFLIIAALKDSRIKKMLDIPSYRHIHGCIIVGYPEHVYKKSIPRKQPRINWF